MSLRARPSRQRDRADRGPRQPAQRDVAGDQLQQQRLRAQVEDVEGAGAEVRRQVVAVPERQVGQGVAQVGEPEDQQDLGEVEAAQLDHVVEEHPDLGELDDPDQQRAGEVEREAGPVAALRARAGGEHRPVGAQPDAPEGSTPSQPPCTSRCRRPARVSTWPRAPTPASQATWTSEQHQRLRAVDAAGEDVDRVHHHRRERRRLGDHLQPVGKSQIGTKSPARKPETTM